MSPAALWPSVVAGVLLFGTNAVLFLGVLRLHTGEPIQRIWVRDMSATIVQFFGLMPLGILLAMVFRSTGLPGLILFWAPLLIARYAFQAYQDVRQAHINTVTALAKAIEAKDPYTKGHSDRVTEYALAIARRLKLPESDLEKLEYATMLHDVGKIGIRDAVLKKPASLNPIEVQEIREHPTIGWNIVKEIRFLGPYLSVIRNHHEWFGGGGYPDRLSGEEIPLGARIALVADAFDAMTTRRPYKRGMTVEEALAEIKKWSGKQFDPVVVDAFIQYVEETPELAARIREVNAQVARDLAAEEAKKMEREEMLAALAMGRGMRLVGSGPLRGAQHDEPGEAAARNEAASGRQDEPVGNAPGSRPPEGET